MPEPESLILQLLRDMRVEMGDLKTELKGEIASLRTELKSDIASLRADVASDINDVRSEIVASEKRTGDKIVGLRRAVMEYHTSVIGHGIVISELEARVRRLEQHLDLPAA